jgi:uncharacterized membrane protein
MHRRYYDLILIVMIVIVNIIWAALPGHLPLVGTILALPLVFVLPGYTLTEILFNKRVQDIIHRVLLSLGLSLAIDIFGGFLLNVFPTGLREMPWAILLGLITILFSLWVVYLRQKTFLGNNYLTNNIYPTDTNTLKISNETPFRFILVVLSFAGIIFSIVYSVISVNQVSRQGFTQLWMLPLAQSSNSCSVSVGIRSFESAPVTYKLVMTVDSVPVRTWSSILLLPEQQWSQQIPLAPKTGGSKDVEADLYRVSLSGVVYRDVHLLFNPLIRDKNGLIHNCAT